MKEFMEKIDKRVFTGLKVTAGVFVVFMILFVALGFKASSSALNYAQLTRNDVSYIRFDFEFDDLLPEYEVKWNVGMKEYEYTVHAFTGEVLKMEID